ncbi:MAG: flagellar basal body P-ring biosynthesis protein [Actinobacteria bacterium]|jgi:hypothetical protein|nr:flagellar basal body P-ring biosynthesis protein [Actinomycetota bacterium]
MKISNLDILKNSRLAMGLALFIIAIASGQLIAREANRTVMVWATQGDLAPGQLISEIDVKPVAVLLPESAKNYLSAKAEIIGALVLTHLSKGDLVPTASITNSSQPLDQRFVPLTLDLNDIPIDLVRGEVVDIYAIPNKDSKLIAAPQLVAANISISNVLERNNSGKASVLVILSNDEVIPTLQLLADSRLVIVRSI